MARGPWRRDRVECWSRTRDRPGLLPGRPGRWRCGSLGTGWACGATPDNGKEASSQLICPLSRLSDAESIRKGVEFDPRPVSRKGARAVIAAATTVRLPFRLA